MPPIGGEEASVLNTHDEATDLKSLAEDHGHQKSSSTNGSPEQIGVVGNGLSSTWRSQLGPGSLSKSCPSRIDIADLPGVYRMPKSSFR